MEERQLWQTDPTPPPPPPPQAFPDTPIIFHSLEAPFLLGDEQYLPPGSLALSVLRTLGIAPAHPVKASYTGQAKGGGACTCGSVERQCSGRPQMKPCRFQP